MDQLKIANNLNSGNQEFTLYKNPSEFHSVIPTCMKTSFVSIH